MPFEELVLVPGIDAEKTSTLNKAGISTGQFIRWKEGLPEKLGGWSRFFPNPIGSIPRELLGWKDVNGNLRLAVGATAALKVITAGAMIDITPQITTTNNVPNFSTVLGSTSVIVVDPGISNPSTNNAVLIATPTAVGGIVLFGVYQIATVLGPTSYTIQAATAATANASNTGAVPQFTTVNGASAVTVTLANHGLTAGQSSGFLIPTIGNGVTISGSYLVQAPVTTNTYVITVNGVATANGSFFENGGNCRITYFIAVGPQSPFSGWGVGTWGSGGWGTGTAQPSGTGTPITAIDYSFANWGEILIANPAGGAIYQWSPEGALQNAAVIPQAPIIADGIFLAQPQQILVAWGVADFATEIVNPLRLVWSDAGNYTVWTPTSSNFAGGFNIPRGSTIVKCMQAPNQFLVWTDIAVWSGQYVGQPQVFSIIEVMAGCGLIGRKAAGILGTTVYWMSQNQFFQMAAGGVPQVLPCTVWDYVFQNLDLANVSKIRFFANAAFTEIGWYFPSQSGGAGENDSYVKFNVVEGEWDTGPMGRSAWIDQSVLGPPIGGTTGGLIYQHETSNDADGVAMNPVIQTGNFVLGKGEEFQFLDYMIPNFRYGKQGKPSNATLLITVNVLDYADDTGRSNGPFAVNLASPNFIEPHLRGRLGNLRIESQDLGTFWRFGLIRYRVAPDGRNP